MTWVHERTEVYRTEVSQVGKYYLKFDARFRQLRSDVKSCGLCFAEFADGEMFNIAFTSRGNKLICQTCTDTAEENGTNVVLWPKAIESTESTQAQAGGRIGGSHE